MRQSLPVLPYEQTPAARAWSCLGSGKKRSNIQKSTCFACYPICANATRNVRIKSRERVLGKQPPSLVRRMKAFWLRSQLRRRVLETDMSDDDENAAPKAAENAAPNAAAKKVIGRPFPKGRSANPAGKKRGTKHRKTLWLEAMSEDDRAAIIAKATRLAKKGDRVVLRMVIDRIDPVRRRVRFPLPSIKTTGDVVNAQAAITAAMAAGKISAAEAFEIGAVVDMTRHAIETHDNEVRLKQLEERFK
jgi:hypothetical protein